jgi:hypothetical protein
MVAVRVDGYSPDANECKTLNKEYGDGWYYGSAE